MEMSQSYPTIIHQGDKADLLDKINPSEIVEVLRNRLMGKEFLNGNWEAVEELQDRALTSKGAWDISNLMLSASSKNVSISKLSDEEIKKRLLNIVKTAVYMCLKNWKEYGIKGVDQLYFVKEIIFSNTLITLKQPENEGVRRMIVGTISESRNVQTVGEERTGGLRGLFRK